MANETNKRFSNRVSDNPNRRELRIVSQTSDSIIADIYRADTVQNEQYGTPIDADILNDWDQKVNDTLSTLQQLTRSVDCSAADNVGTPSVEIKDINGEKRFVFKNLKGKEGGTKFLFNGMAQNKVTFSVNGSVLTITTTTE